jgi:hypothetical protein
VSIITCHSGEYDSPEIIHMTVEECNASALPGESCRTPLEHHAPRSRVDLEHGKWSYIVLVSDFTQETEDPIEVFVDATPSLPEAIRIARRAVTPHPAFNSRVKTTTRRGLAYGILIENVRLATIIPTPRHVEVK